ncbi:MAG: hypothetical protein GY810_32420 [Aureispira sp.]|nr:hypothetical protein [Aureispira sp.]
MSKCYPELEVIFDDIDVLYGCVHNLMLRIEDLESVKGLTYSEAREKVEASKELI